jgi:hypothetical protein
MRCNADDKHRLWYSHSVTYILCFRIFRHVHFCCHGSKTWPQPGGLWRCISCVRVIMNFCISCTCIIKAVTIAVSCHVTSSEVSHTSTTVQKLLSQRPIRADTLTELQLFFQKLRNTNPSFTASGFFELSLNLLCSMAGTATTYIVILLQLKWIYIEKLKHFGVL